MDNAKHVTTRRGASPTKQASSEPLPEQVMDAFKAAALSVTKLYKTAAAAETRARSDGYQDCLDDLLAFLDRENIGLDDGEGWRIRRWATERLDGREPASPESEDEVEKTEPLSSSTELTKPAPAPQSSLAKSDSTVRMSTPPPPPPNIVDIAEEPQIVVPSQDVFTFQSSYPYPQLENLELSDTSRSYDAPSTTTQASTPASRHARSRNPGSGRAGSRNQLGRGAGQKRKVNLADFFDLGTLGYGKDPFGGGKRSRHA